MGDNWELLIGIKYYSFIEIFDVCGYYYDAGNHIFRQGNAQPLGANIFLPILSYGKTLSLAAGY